VPGDGAPSNSAETSIRDSLSAAPRELREAQERILRALLAVPAGKAADPRFIAPITRERILVSRTHGSALADLVDAHLVLDLLEVSEEPSRDDLLSIWGPFLEGVAASAYAPNPAIFTPRQPVHSVSFRAFAATMRSYFRAHLYWCERTGIPRRWLLNAHGVSRLRVAQHIAVGMGGFRPVWQTHLPPLPPGEHLLESAYVRSHLEIARALPRHPAIRGIASSSWYYDPDVAAVSPHLEYIPRLLAGNGCLCFEVPNDDAMRESALRTSRTRRIAHGRGEYTPRAYARLWSRAAILRWAEKQPGWQLALAVNA
jgi:hypothetical protein